MPETRQFYSWDIATLANYLEPRVETEVGRDRSWGAILKTPEPHPFVKYGLLDETLVPMANPRDGFTRTRVVSPMGRAWLDREFARLEERYNRREGKFYRFDCHLGQIILFDIGLDIFTEWNVIFGVTAPMYTDCVEMPKKWRPWHDCRQFIDSTYETYPRMDSYGYPALGGSLEAWFSFAYCNLLEVSTEGLDYFIKQDRRKFTKEALLRMYEVAAPDSVQVPEPVV